jgi:hypothetical protein
MYFAVHHSANANSNKRTVVTRPYAYARKRPLGPRALITRMPFARNDEQALA